MSGQIALNTSTSRGHDPAQKRDMTIKYSFYAAGSSKFFRVTADAHDEFLQPFFDSENWEYTKELPSADPALQMDRNPQANAGLAVLGVISIFISTKFAEKIFDEVYERTGKRPIGNFLDYLFRKMKPEAGSRIEYRDTIRFEDLNLVVVVRAFVTQQSAENVHSLILLGHRMAHEFIQQNGRKSPVHCYTIRDGRISLEPELFESLEEIKQNDMRISRSFWPEARGPQ